LAVFCISPTPFNAVSFEDIFRGSVYAVLPLSQQEQEMNGNEMDVNKHLGPAFKKGAAVEAPARKRQQRMALAALSLALVSGGLFAFQRSADIGCDVLLDSAWADAGARTGLSSLAFGVEESEGSCVFTAVDDVGAVSNDTKIYCDRDTSPGELASDLRLLLGMESALDGTGYTCGIRQVQEGVAVAEAAEVKEGLAPVPVYNPQKERGGTSRSLVSSKPSLRGSGKAKASKSKSSTGVYRMRMTVRGVEKAPSGTLRSRMEDQAETQLNQLARRKGYSSVRNVRVTDIECKSNGICMGEASGVSYKSGRR
jgi:hypothetical protein